jgi:hypothetical protein
VKSRHFERLSQLKEWLVGATRRTKWTGSNAIVHKTDEKKCKCVQQGCERALAFDVSCCWSWAFFRLFASPAKSTPHHFTPSNDNCYLPIYTCGMLKSSGSQSFLKFMSSSDL